MMVDMPQNLEIYWSQKMSPEEKEKLELFKSFTVKGGVPEDLTKAIQTFIQ